MALQIAQAGAEYLFPFQANVPTTPGGSPLAKFNPCSPCCRCETLFCWFLQVSDSGATSTFITDHSAQNAVGRYGTHIDGGNHYTNGLFRPTGGSIYSSSGTFLGDVGYCPSLPKSYFQVSSGVYAASGLFTFVYSDPCLVNSSGTFVIYRCMSGSGTINTEYKCDKAEVCYNCTFARDVMPSSLAVGCTWGNGTMSLTSSNPTYLGTFVGTGAGKTQCCTQDGDAIFCASVSMRCYDSGVPYNGGTTANSPAVLSNHRRYILGISAPACIVATTLPSGDRDICDVFTNHFSTWATYPRQLTNSPPNSPCFDTGQPTSACNADSIDPPILWTNTLFHTSGTCDHCAGACLRDIAGLNCPGLAQGLIRNGNGCYTDLFDSITGDAEYLFDCNNLLPVDMVFTIPDSVFMPGGLTVTVTEVP
jgi:hypothetical protein